MVCDTPIWVLPKGHWEKVPVPCGKCPNCKFRRVNSWAFRLMQEEKRSTASHFVTFTYDTRSVPISVNGFMTLRKEDLQLFFKRLRKLTGPGVKYYAVGEYGSTNYRPHYHAIIFNVTDPELYAQAWSVDGEHIGTVHVGTVTQESVGYTLKYIDKPDFKRDHGRDDRAPQFSLMSKGLGDNYLTDDIIKYHHEDLDRMYLTKPGGFTIALPKYYRDKIYNDDQKSKQREMILSVSEETEHERYLRYQRLYPNMSYDQYLAYKDHQRFARYKKFYSNQKNRDV